MQKFDLKNGEKIPVIGIGTWELTGDTAKVAVESALKIGYRHIDTAIYYQNHKEIGHVIKESGIDRDELFVTSKVFQTLRKNEVIDSCKKSLDELGLEYLDLYLIHWPDRSIELADTLEGFQSLRADGLIRSIGVSNFTINHLKDAQALEAQIVMNQVEFHPTLNQVELKNFCDENNILMTAYSSMAKGSEPKVPEIVDIAKKHNASPHQVIIKWTIQNGIVAIPRSSKVENIRDNFRALDVELDEEDMKILNNLDAGNRVIKPPFHDFDY